MTKEQMLQILAEAAAEVVRYAEQWGVKPEQTLAGRLLEQIAEKVLHVTSQ